MDDMFEYIKPSDLNRPWILSGYDEAKTAKIPTDILKSLKNYDVLSIEFLFQKYQNKFSGAILNEEHEFNTQLQVSVFLNVMLNFLNNTDFLILVLCPDSCLANWHYHLTLHGKFNVILLQTENLKNFGQHRTALLVPFSNMKLLDDDVLDNNYFSVIIDHMDEIATKQIIRRLQGGFNIGITQRSFYENPDQKLQWTLLNWSNPGCVGKLSQFYGIDNDNFINFRDNYRHWWFRLTWSYCESFQKPTEEDIKAYEEEILNWSNKLTLHKMEKRESKRKFESKSKNSKKYKNNNKKLKTSKSEQVEVNKSIIKTDDTSHILVLVNEEDKNDSQTEVKSEPFKKSESTPSSSRQVLETNSEDKRNILELQTEPDFLCPKQELRQFTYNSSQEDRDMVKFLLGSNVQERKLKKVVSSEVEDILTQADKLLS